MEYSPKKMQDQIINNKFSFKKKFGQNFIIDENVINNIVNNIIIKIIQVLRERFNYP